jgi:hypothetical protein
LDTKSEIFQNLNGATDDIKFDLDDDDNDDIIVFNNATKTKPGFIHGNGGSKGILNFLGNYIAKAWSVSDGCKICNEDKIVLSEVSH